MAVNDIVAQNGWVEMNWNLVQHHPPPTPLVQEVKNTVLEKVH